MENKILVEKTEECWKCGGDGFTMLDDGSMPCFLCSTTGRLPFGSRAALCPSCDQSGQIQSFHPEDGSEIWSDCPSCRPTIKPKPMPCGHYSHEEGGPSDYPAKCRI